MTALIPIKILHQIIELKAVVVLKMNADWTEVTVTTMVEHKNTITYIRYLLRFITMGVRSSL